MLAYTKVSIALIIFFLIFIVGGILLQIFLSKKESRWPGLILPMITFAISILAVLAVIMFSAFKGTTTLTENGRVIKETTETIISKGQIFLSAVYVFFINNISTGVLLAIYFACRGKQKRKREMEKMNIQDIE